MQKVQNCIILSVGILSAIRPIQQFYARAVLNIERSRLPQAYTNEKIIYNTTFIQLYSPNGRKVNLTKAT